MLNHTQHSEGFKVRTYSQATPEADIIVHDDLALYAAYHDAVAAWAGNQLFVDGRMYIEITSVTRVKRVSSP